MTYKRKAFIHALTAVAIAMPISRIDWISISDKIIFAALKDISTENVSQQYAGKEFSLFKKDLSDLVVEKIQPIGKEINKLMKDQSYLDSIMINGKNKAIVEADSVLTKVYDIIGLQKS